MERVARLKAALKELARLGLSGARVHRRPLRRELGAALKAPVAEPLGDVSTNLVATEVLEEAPPNNLADFSLVVCNEVLRHSPHYLGNPVLLLLVPLGHLYLTAR